MGKYKSFKEYNKSLKFRIKTPNPNYKKDIIKDCFENIHINNKDSEMYNSEYFYTPPRTESYISSKYKLNIDEVLKNINKLRKYEGSIFNKPIIIEIV